MKKIVWTYGLIAGAIVSALMGASVAYCTSNPNFKHSYAIGYATMLLAFTMIFMGIKTYRDKYNGGVVSFGKAFRVGLYIALISSTIYVAAWAIEYNLLYPDFMQKYSATVVNDLKAAGTTQATIDTKVKEMAKMAEWYKNPVFFVLLTYAEILPLGLVVSLICALILKRKQKQAAGA